MTTRSLKSGAFAAAALCLCVRGAFADPSVSYTTAGAAYTQNFDTLWTMSTNPPQNLELSIPAVVIGPTVVGSAPIDLTGPSADGSPPDRPPTITNIGDPTLMAGWYATSYGGNSTPLTYNVNDGSSGTVALTAYYDPNHPTNGDGSNNLTLGALAASGSGNIEFGVRLINNTGGDLNTISLSALGALFHQDVSAKSLKFGYAVASATAGIPTSGLTLVNALNVGGFAAGTLATVGAVTQSAASEKNVSVSNLTLATTWTSGSALWLTWTLGVGGSGQGLSIDNLNFSATNLPPAQTLTWNQSGGGAWDSGTANWTGTGGTTTFGSTGTFNAAFGALAADSTITIQAGGITVPASVTINNTNNTKYTFTGGPIAGAGASLTINGGIVQLTSPNTYGNATNLNGGTLIVDADAELGSLSGTLGAQLNINGGTLQLNGDLLTTIRPLLVTTVGGTINLNGHNASFTGDSNATVNVFGALHVTGGGNLNLGLQPLFLGGSSGPYGSLNIDAGSSVTIVGNTRGSPSEFYASSVINGNLILQGNPLGTRINFDSPGTPGSTNHNGDNKFTGTGEIDVVSGSGWVDVGVSPAHAWQLDTNGVVISNTSKTYAGEIDVGIHLNSSNKPFQTIDVTQANFISATSPGGSSPFVTVIGGTKTGNAGQGNQFANLIIGGVISGKSDISIGNDYGSGGSGDLTLNAKNTYTGATIINTGKGTELHVGVDDALPTTTNVIFGAFSGAGAGSLDLSGHNQHVNSIEIGLGTNAPQSNSIINSGATPATLYVTGDITPFYPFNGQLNDGGTTVTGVVNNQPLALVKSGLGTLKLGEYIASGHTTQSTYSGGTTISGGTLEISFDGALGNTFVGALTLDGGTLSVQDEYFQGNPTDNSESTIAFNSDRHLNVTANGGTLSSQEFQATLSFTGNTVTLVEPVTYSGNGGYNWGSAAAAPLNINTAAAGAAPASSVTFNGGSGVVAVTPGATFLVSAGSTLNIGGTSDPLTDTATGLVHVNIVNNSATGLNILNGSKAAGTIDGTGTTTVATGASLTADHIVQGSLVLTGTAAATIRSNGTNSGTSKLGGLSIDGGLGAWTGNLNINNNKLIIEATALTMPTALATVQDQANYGLTHSAGITTSAFGKGIALAVVDNGALSTPFSNFGGVQVDNNSILVAPELMGDANLDGVVNFSDFVALSNHFGTSGAGWSGGDFNGDGIVNFSDFVILSNNFGASMAGSSEMASVGESSLGSFAASSVPEPTSLALLGLGALALAKRRRRAAR